MVKQFGKRRITLRLDDDILDWLRRQAGEGGWECYPQLVNAALREHMRQSERSLEQILRKVLREELNIGPEHITE